MHTPIVVRGLLAAIALALFGLPTLAQGVDPIIGTWELNVAKSKFSPGPAPRRQTRTYVQAGPEIKATTKGEDSTGKPTTSEWAMSYDEKERPIVGNPDADTLSLKRIDAYTVEFTQKRAGKLASTGRRTISKDGKVMTITNKGTNAKGQAMDEVLVFEKRP